MASGLVPAIVREMVAWLPHKHLIDMISQYHFRSMLVNSPIRLFSLLEERDTAADTRYVDKAMIIRRGLEQIS